MKYELNWELKYVSPELKYFTIVGLMAVPSPLTRVWFCPPAKVMLADSTTEASTDPPPARKKELVSMINHTLEGRLTLNEGSFRM